MKLLPSHCSLCHTINHRDCCFNKLISLSYCRNEHCSDNWSWRGDSSCEHSSISVPLFYPLSYLSHWKIIIIRPVILSFKPSKINLSFPFPQILLHGLPFSCIFCKSSFSHINQSNLCHVIWCFWKSITDSFSVIQYTHLVCHSFNGLPSLPFPYNHISLSLPHFFKSM